ncbi:MAG: SLC13 family permease, partial [Verrucomicrobiaceae bacterium]
MTQEQSLSFLILGATMALFLWGRIRYDLVALLALLVSVACGTVSAKEAFRGFSDDIVIIVGSALVISAAVARSGIVESVLHHISSRLKKVSWQLTLLVGSVTLLSALVKNIGALAMMMPAAMKIARRSNHSPSAFLMPMSFGSLLGGLITLIGTSPNIIVSRVREEVVGEPFRMFDYAPVGLGLSLVGLLFLHFGYRLLPKDRRATPTLGEALDIKDYTTSAEIPEDSKWLGKTVAAFQKEQEGEVRVSAVLRPAGEAPETLVGVETVLEAGDTLLLKGDPEALERVIATEGLLLEGQRRALVTENPVDSIGVIEAVVASGSALVRSSIGKLGLHEIHGVNLLAISRAGKRMTEGLGDTRLQAGDVIVLQGQLELLPERLKALGCLPLAQREIALGSARRGLVPLA